MTASILGQLTRDGLFTLCAKSIKLRPNNGAASNAVPVGLRGLEPRKPMVTIPRMTDEGEAAAASTPERASSSSSMYQGGKISLTSMPAIRRSRVARVVIQLNQSH